MQFKKLDCSEILPLCVNQPLAVVYVTGHQPSYWWETNQT